MYVHIPTNRSLHGKVHPEGDDGGPETDRPSSGSARSCPVIMQIFTRLGTQMPGDWMDRAVRDDANCWHDKLTTLLFSMEPLTALLRLRVGQALAFVLFVPWIVLRVRGIRALRDKGFFFPNEGNFHVTSALHHAELGRSCGSEARLELLSGLLPPVALLLAALAATLRRVTWVRKTFVVVGLIDAMLNVLIFVRLERHPGYNQTISGTPSFLFLLVAIKDLLLFPCPLWFCEASVIELCLLSNLIYLCAAAAWFVSYESIVALVLLGSALQFRKLLIHRGERFIEEGSSVFSEEWSAMMHRDSQGIQLLAERVKEHQLAVSPHVEHVGEDIAALAEQSHSVARVQRFYASVTGLSYESEAQSVHQRADLEVVDSLDQLYALAVLVEPFFRMKVHSMADATNGMLALQVREDDSSMEYKRLQEIQENVSLGKQLDQPGLKTASRAMQKLVLLCGGEPRRLLDL
eukprot:756013-Hanusia_phi.AAC.1